MSQSKNAKINVSMIFMVNYTHSNTAFAANVNIHNPNNGH